MDRHNMSGYSEPELEDKDETEKKIHGWGERSEVKKGGWSQMKTSNAFIIGCQTPA